MYCFIVISDNTCLITIQIIWIFASHRHKKTGAVAGLNLLVVHHLIS